MTDPCPTCQVPGLALVACCVCQTAYCEYCIGSLCCKCSDLYCLNCLLEQDRNETPQYFEKCRECFGTMCHKHFEEHETPEMISDNTMALCKECAGTAHEE